MSSRRYAGERKDLMEQLHRKGLKESTAQDIQCGEFLLGKKLLFCFLRDTGLDRQVQKFN